MPGLFGFIDPYAAQGEPTTTELTEVLRRMLAAMLYEPSYASTLFVRPELGAYVGVVSFKQTTPPDVDSTGGASLVVTAGELAEDLSHPGQPVDSLNRGDARTFGDAAIQRISGQCAAFVLDRQAGRCYLLNDRYGRERLFVYTDGSRTFFASEAKAILAVAPRTRAFDAAGLAELLACGCTRGSRSLFRNIEVLAPGTQLTFSRSGVSRRRYFKPEDLEQLDPVAPEQFFEGFADSLRAAVGRSVRSAPPVGISLTGGLDSRMIMASLDAPDGSVPCYTFGSMFRKTGDVAVASQVAARCRQPHRVLELGNAFLARIQEDLEHAVYVSDGYIGLSGAAELHVNRQARALAPARMTGNWGGELMRGVRAFKFVVPKGGFLTPYLGQAMQTSAEAFSNTYPHPVSAALFDQIPYQGFGRYAIERSQMVMRSPFLAEDVVSWLYRAPASVRESGAGAAAVIGRRPELLAIPTDVGLLGRRSSFVRRASRRALIKAEYLTSHGAPDWMARLGARLPAPLLETRFLGVDKFQHFRFWTRRDLANFVRDTLVQDDHGELGEWVDLTRIRRMVDDHIDGYANYTNEIDRLLTIVTARKLLFKRFEARQ